MKSIYRVESIYKEKFVLIGYFETETEAQKAAYKQGLPGTNNHGRVIKIDLFESFDEFRSRNQARIKQIAENKLTTDEIRILKETWIKELLEKQEKEKLSENS